jgi:integrase
MRRLASTEAATRRQIAQLLIRVLNLAVYPGKVIQFSPIPRGWLPQAKRKAKSYLYPAEDAKLLACTDIPLVFRLLYGLLAREGMRCGEAAALDWTDITDAGELNLDENKTDEPRTWALDPAVFRALVAWKGMQRPKRACVFTTDDGERMYVRHLAHQLREHLVIAGVNRPALFAKTEKRLRFRVHDLRGTFVTLALANGKTETWVVDRTGHKSSGMVANYRSTARSAAELSLGSLLPLDEAIPELRAGWGSDGARAAKLAAHPVKAMSCNS